MYRVLDGVLATGEPVEIERNGRLLRIIAVDGPESAAAGPDRRDVIVGDPGDLAEIGWDEAWQPDR